VRALLHTSAEFGVELHVTAGVERANARQKGVVFDKLAEVLGGGAPGALRGARVAVWGLAFKPQTDDLRESPAMLLIDRLLEAGATVAAHDPVAAAGARETLGDRVAFAETSYEALAGADALAVMTDWNEYRNPDFRRMRDALARPVVVDARNLYDPARMAALGFHYQSIGRESVGGAPAARAGTDATGAGVPALA
jgi:UDPglucose 6-dehydrogenase